MVFSTLTFLFAFLPIVCILYFLIPNRTYKNVILLIFSLVFYSWGEPKYIVLVLAASFVAYVGGLLIHRFDAKKKLKKTVFIITVVLLVANLFVFKYLDFTITQINGLFNSSFALAKIVLPIGISFYTFQILSYVIDLYKKEVSVQKNYFYLTLYVTFFPQLIAGPIVRYQTIEDEINARKESLDDFVCGLRRFIVGLAKKVIIANNVGAIAVMIYSGDAKIYGTQFYWLAAIAYALQIYFDFSGYSDMAIGLGRMFGFHFLENFNYPYIATSITDFWRRWHISLSTWFRDYVYIPLGGNRVKKHRWLLNILIVWALTGFWHGAEWNFIAWGLYYAALLICEKLFLHKLLKKLPKFLCWLYAMLIVLVGWVMFNLTEPAAIIHALSQMFSFRYTDITTAVIANTDIVYALIYVPLGLICMLPWKNKQFRIPDWLANMICLALLAISIVFLVGSTYNPFIYFRF
ncbi:MAG: MBOAT family protein [Oscillospiraceae bacterium]|nr:MBOAT family protein [Oscillospiraceae bacterium]